MGGPVLTFNKRTAGIRRQVVDEDSYSDQEESLDGVAASESDESLVEEEAVVPNEKKKGRKKRGGKKKKKAVEGEGAAAPVAVAEQSKPAKPEPKDAAESDPKDLSGCIIQIKSIDRKIAIAGIKVANMMFVIYEKAKVILKKDTDEQTGTPNNADHFMCMPQLTRAFNERKFGTVGTIDENTYPTDETRKEKCKEILGNLDHKRPPQNIDKLDSQMFIFESNIAYNTSDTKRVDFTGERPVFGYQATTGSQTFRSIKKDFDYANRDKIFSMNEEVTESIRYISTIFPLKQSDERINNIRNYLEESNIDDTQANKILSLLDEMTSHSSTIRWINTHRPRTYKTSDYITYLCRTTGISSEIPGTNTFTVRRIEIHKKMVLTRIKDSTSSSGLMVMCEEIIIQLQEKHKDLTTDAKNFNNTSTCLVLTSRAQEEKGYIKDANGKLLSQPDCIHYQGMGSLSIILSENPIDYAGILDRKIDMIVTTAWLIEQLSNATSNKSANNEKALKLFQKLVTYEHTTHDKKSGRSVSNGQPIRDAASITRIRRFMAQEKTPPTIRIPADDRLDIIQNSFLTFQRAHMILPRKNKFTSENNPTQRCTVLEFFTTPSFALMVIAITGGEKPLNYVFLKTYGIHGCSKTNEIVGKHEDQVSSIQEHRTATPHLVKLVEQHIRQSKEDKPVVLNDVEVTDLGELDGVFDPCPKHTEFNPSSHHTQHLQFDDLLRSMLPEELELELELL